MTREPRWLAKDELLELHEYVIARTGGAAGVRDEGLLESALARAEHRHHYEGEVRLPELAAAYGLGLAKNHPFVDGNKRAAFLAIGLFLELNGLMLTAGQDDATRVMLGVAASEIGEAELAAWIGANTAPA